MTSVESALQASLQKRTAAYRQTVAENDELHAELARSKAENRELRATVDDISRQLKRKRDEEATTEDEETARKRTK